MPCWFCNRDVPLTAEHVFPRWVQPFLLDETEAVGTHTRLTIRAGEETVEERTHRGLPATTTSRCVCAGCNNGWMSRLEAEAKPLLLKVLRGEPSYFDEDARRTLATWFVKTALVAGAKFDPALPGCFYEQLCTDGEPSANTRVYLAATPYEFQHYTDFRPIRTEKTLEPPPAIPNAYSAVLALGQVVGFVLSWLDVMPSRRRLMREFGPALVRLWPTHLGIATWPPEAGRINFAGLDRLSDAIVSTGEVVSNRPYLNR
jgi:hypothetical protein